MAANRISALIHTFNDERRLGRTLETLRPCDEVVIVDHASSDNTARVAHNYGAKLIHAVAGVNEGAYANDCKYDWVLCLLPCESLTEALEASLFEWKANGPADGAAYSIAIRAEGSKDRQKLAPESRLVNRTKINWQGRTPATVPNTALLEGDLLRFAEDDSR